MILAVLTLLLIASSVTVGVSASDNGGAELKTEPFVSASQKETTTAVPESTSQHAEPSARAEGSGSAGAEKEKTSKAQPPTGFSRAESEQEWVTPNNKERPKDEERQPVRITVVLSVNCENAVAKGFDIAPYLLQNEPYKAEEGATVFDVLQALCEENEISLKYQRKSYIQGIGGLNEKDCGGASGWMYLVNGEKPNKAINSYQLKNGDVIELRYVTESNE